MFAGDTEMFRLLLRSGAGTQNLRLLVFEILDPPRSFRMTLIPLLVSITSLTLSGFSGHPLWTIITQHG